MTTESSLDVCCAWPSEDLPTRSEAVMDAYT